MFDNKKSLKLQLTTLAAALLVAGPATAGIRFALSIPVISANYKVITPDFEPNLLSSTTNTFTHKLYAVDFDPNEVQIQRRIRQGWYTETDPVKHCINTNGTRDNGCSWKDWNLDWQYSYTTGDYDSIKVYTVDVSIAGDAYANWPLFPAEDGAYQPNPNFVSYAPKTKYTIETRYYHPTAGWLYDTETISLWCDGQLAWEHYAGQTTCPGI